MGIWNPTTQNPDDWQANLVLTPTVSSNSSKKFSILKCVFSSLQIRLHCQSHRPARRPGNPVEQLEGPGASKPSVYHRCYRHRGWDLLPLHSPARLDERVPGPRIERSKRSAQVNVVPVWVHWRNGKGLHLLCDVTIWGCFDGSVIIFNFTGALVHLGSEIRKNLKSVLFEGQISPFENQTIQNPVILVRISNSFWQNLWPNLLLTIKNPN